MPVKTGGNGPIMFALNYVPMTKRISYSQRTACNSSSEERDGEEGMGGHQSLVYARVARVIAFKKSTVEKDERVKKHEEKEGGFYVSARAKKEAKYRADIAATATQKNIEARQRERAQGRREHVEAWQRAQTVGLGVDKLEEIESKLAVEAGVKLGVWRKDHLLGLQRLIRSPKSQIDLINQFLYNSC